MHGQAAIKSNYGTAFVNAQFNQRPGASRSPTGECVTGLEVAGPRFSRARSYHAAPGWQVKDVDQALVFVDGVV